jgi:hypothetical protein
MMTAPRAALQQLREDDHIHQMNRDIQHRHRDWPPRPHQVHDVQAGARDQRQQNGEIQLDQIGVAVNRTRSPA